MMLSSPCGCHYTALILRNRNCVNNNPVIDSLFTYKSILLAVNHINLLICNDNYTLLHYFGIHNRSSRHKIKKALINQGFFISISQQSLFWRKPIYFPSGMDTKGCGFGGNNRDIVCGPET